MGGKPLLKVNEWACQRHRMREARENHRNVDLCGILTPAGLCSHSDLGVGTIPVENGERPVVSLFKNRSSTYCKKTNTQGTQTDKKKKKELQTDEENNTSASK